MRIWERMICYAIWIRTEVKGCVYGRCDEVTKEMQKVFPELIRTKGIYHCPEWGERTHWWLKTPEGEIVDPTARQFPSQGDGRYQELSDDELPTGKCMNCGKLIFNGKYHCSEECGKILEKYYDCKFE